MLVGISMEKWGLLVWLLTTNNSSKTIYIIPNLKPEYGGVCRGSQKKVRKSTPSTGLFVSSSKIPWSLYHHQKYRNRLYGFVKRTHNQPYPCNTSQLNQPYLLYEFGWYNLEMDAWVNLKMNAWVNFLLPSKRLTNVKSCLYLPSRRLNLPESSMIAAWVLKEEVISRELFLPPIAGKSGTLICMLFTAIPVDSYFLNYFQDERNIFC